VYGFDNLGFSIRQSLWEQAQCFLCDVCGCPLDVRVVKCVLKLPKPDSLTYHLHFRLENHIVYRALGLFKKFYRAEFEPKMRFGCIAHNLMHYSG